MYVGYVARKKNNNNENQRIYFYCLKRKIWNLYGNFCNNKKTLKIYAVEACCVQHDCMILSVPYVCLSVFEHFQSVGDVKPKKTDEQSDGSDGRTAIWVASSNGCHLSFVYICRLNEICIEWLEKNPKTNWKIACIYRKSGRFECDDYRWCTAAHGGVSRGGLFFIYTRSVFSIGCWDIFSGSMWNGQIFWKVKLNIHYYSCDEL